MFSFFLHYTSKRKAQENTNLPVSDLNPVVRVKKLSATNLGTQNDTQHTQEDKQVQMPSLKLNKPKRIGKKGFIRSPKRQTELKKIISPKREEKSEVKDFNLRKRKNDFYGATSKNNQETAIKIKREIVPPLKNEIQIVRPLENEIVPSENDSEMIGPPLKKPKRNIALNCTVKKEQLAVEEHNNNDENLKGLMQSPLVEQKLVLKSKKDTKKNPVNPANKAKGKFNNTEQNIPEGRGNKHFIENYSMVNNLRRKRNIPRETTTNHTSNPEIQMYPSNEQLAQEHPQNFEKIVHNFKRTVIKIERLTLQDMSWREIMGTFNEHKENLDKLFEANKDKPYINDRSRKVNSLLVNDLTNNSIKDKIIENLNKIYGSKGSNAFATHFANVLMPEWLLGIFMKKYDFTREQAIRQLEDQEKYQLHLQNKVPPSLR